MVQAALIVYLVTACYLADPGRRLWILGWLLILALLNVAVGARQFVVGDDFMLNGMVRSAQYAGRASGLYICPDHLAGYLEVVGLLALSATLWSRCQTWVKILLAYTVACCFTGLVLTGSRGGFLSLGVGLAVLIPLSLARLKAVAPRTFPRAVFAALLVSVLLGLVGAYGVSRSTLLKSRASTLIVRDVRFQVWPSALKEWTLAPVFGTGSATFLYYGRRFRSPGMLVDPINTHNDYLQFLAEYGAVGVAGLLLFLGAHLRRGWEAYRYLSLRTEEQRTRAGNGGSNAAAWNIGALAAVAAIAAHSVVDFNLHIPVNSLLMAFVFGVLANPGREVSLAGFESGGRVFPVDYLPRLALPVLGIWLAAGGLPHLPGEYYAEKARQALRDKQNLAGLNFALEGVKHEALNPSLYYYIGEGRQALADDIPNAMVSRSFREAAVEPYREGLRLFPNDVRLMLRLGSALTLLGRYDEAGPVLRRALEWDPLLPLTHTYYGSYLRYQGNFAEAETAFRDALKLAPDATASTSLEQMAGNTAGSSLNN